MKTRTRNTYYLMARPWHTDQWLATIKADKRVTSHESRVTSHLPLDVVTFKAAKPSPACYQSAPKGDRLFLPCNCPVCRTQWTSSAWADENIIAPPEPLAETTIDKVKHINTFTCYHGESLQVYHGVLRFHECDALKERLADALKERLADTPDDVCERCQAERKALKEGISCKVKTAHTCYADAEKKTRDSKGEYRPTGKATCEALFCHGEKDEDGFSRTIALRYLSKRMVFQPKSNAKGIDAPEGTSPLPKTARAAKTSSSRHNFAFYVASDIEDTIQEAATLYRMAVLVNAGKDSWTASEAATIAELDKKERKRIERIARNLEGNRLHDTCAVCQQAKQVLTRARHAERKRIALVDNKGRKTTFGLVAMMRAHRQETQERSKANVIADYGPELQELMDAVTMHGTENIKQLAEVLGTYPMDISRRFARIRDAKARQEAELGRDRTQSPRMVIHGMRV